MNQPKETKWRRATHLDAVELVTDDGKIYTFATAGAEEPPCWVLRISASSNRTIWVTTPNIEMAPIAIQNILTREYILFIELLGDLNQEPILRGLPSQVINESRVHQQKEMSVMEYYGLKEEE